MNKVLLRFDACVLAALIASGTSFASAQTPTKLWSVDLSTDKDFCKRLDIAEVSLHEPYVNFLSNSKIIVDFYDEPEIGFNASPWERSYHVLELDATTGAFGKKLDFRAFDDNSRAFPISDGGFIVLAEEKLNKFDSSFDPGPSYPTPLSKTNEPHDVWRIDLAPGGNEVLAYHRFQGSLAEFLWLRTSDLSTVKKQATTIHSVVRASDTDAITEKHGPKCDTCSAYFLSDDRLIIDEKNHNYSIESVEGTKVSSGKLEGGFGDFARSERSSRVAFLTGHYVGTGFPLKTHFDQILGAFVVLDWKMNKTIARITVKEPAGNPSAGLSQSALALSPDGKYLAVLLHHTLTCYELQ